MEFPFDINSLFPERISVLDHHLQPGRRTHTSKATLENQLATVLDKMGEASAKAQQLSAPITNTLRMQTNQHRLYLLKDGHANHGKGVTIGFLKVGHKKLFVLDGRGAHIEMEPLCVLDFYVHVSLQRHGYGKELFDYMIQYESVKPDHLAIDRPSSKFLCFLRKHYGLASTIPQVNNFVVFESFFRDRHLPGERLVHRPIPKKVEQEIKPYSIAVRDGAPEDQELPWPFNQSHSLTRTNSLGRSPYRQLGRPQINHQEALRHIRVAHPQSVNGARETDDLMNHRRRTSTPEQQGMVAMGNMYSRYNKNSVQSPECVAERPRPADSDQDPPRQAEHREQGVTSQPDQPTQNVPPLDLKGLTCDSDSNRKPPCAGDIEPPPAPRGPERSLVGQRDPKAVSPLAENTQTWEGPSLGKPEERPHVGRSRDGDRQVASVQQAQREEEAASLRGAAIPWVELGVSLSAQWIRRKHEFRNTRPW
ncbi:alpha-tubulin N-acetyltransferase 1 isoform X1 [Scyliorhinus canicula]|uniref:alpha-tubulin N-acetyltransferase 1 isoform X1 n=1 Tax=Scyliorhinus canicula TaxID=7830 RepID=UPI0018F3CF04|nr:alpha-tubulin N-acetyltransferase 1 isoform X1 [Scyliorhinus canicula]